MSTLLQSKDKLTESLSICADCEEPTDSEASSYDGEEKIVCDRCNENYTWCNVCQTHNYSDFQSPCRHLFFDESDGEWAGGKSEWEAYVERKLSEGATVVWE